MQSMNDALGSREPTKDVPTVSAMFKDGGILEMLHDPEARKTSFAYWRDGSWKIESGHAVNAVYKLVPYSAFNNLIRHEIVLLPREPEEYGTEQTLVAEIRQFIHRYVVVSALFEQIATYYVLFSWIYDGFNELPYLRVRGHPGTGKTRFLLTIGSLCYKPIFASGASSVSPIFRLLETFKGTLIIDESDFRFSDEKADLVKILNNGNVRGFPVLRSEGNGKGEFNPHAYHVFGPKIVATRGDFDDRALESRFLTEDMGREDLRHDVPINLPPAHTSEALTLRNKLLLFRFRSLKKRPVLPDLADPTLEPRINQIFVPLLSIIDDPKAREDLRAMAQQCQRDIIAERGLDTEARVLEVIRDLINLPGSKLSVKEITDRFSDLYGEEYERKISAKWIGGIIRKKLHLRAERGREGFMIAESEVPRILQLLQRYGLPEQNPAL
jgi:hypothetical protein